MTPWANTVPIGTKLLNGKLNFDAVITHTNHIYKSIWERKNQNGDVISSIILAQRANLFITIDIKYFNSNKFCFTPYSNASKEVNYYKKEIDDRLIRGGYVELTAKQLVML